MINNSNSINRLLMTTDTAGGVWDYSLELVKGLTQKGIQVLLAAMGPKPDSYKMDAIEKISNLTFAYSPFKLEWMENPWENIDKAGEWLMSLNLSFNPDLIHLNQFSFTSLNWGAPVLVVGHSDIFSWYDSVKGESPDNYKKYFKVVQKGLLEADMVTAPSRTMLESLMSIYGVFKTDGHIYNGRDSKDFTADMEIKEDFILTAGRIWDEGKNIASLDKAAPLVNMRIKAAGNLEEDKNRKKLENIDYLGSLSAERLHDYMSHASIYALPAKYEPFGLTVLEAAFSGCALVLGDIPSLREIWDDAAIFVNPDSISDIASKLNTLAEDKELIKEYSDKAIMRAAEFSADFMVESYSNLYQKLVQEKTGPKIGIDADNQN